MRLLIGLLVGALAALTLPLGDPRPPEPPTAREIFRGKLTHLDGSEIAHSQVMIVIKGRPGHDKPFSYHLTIDCEDQGIEFSRGPGVDPEPEKGRWGSFHAPSRQYIDGPLPEFLTPEYLCPAADPARFARVMAVLAPRSTLDFAKDDHAEFRSEAGSARFKWSPEPMIL